MATLRALGLTEPHAVHVAWAALVLRATWLLPDWLGKWHGLLRRRRRARA